MTFDDCCERLRCLRLDRSGGLVKPYKPLMLAAVVLLTLWRFDDRLRVHPAG